MPQLHQVAASQAFNAVVIAGGRGSHPRAANESLFVERVHCNVDVFLAVAEPLADGLRRVQALVADSGLRLYTWSMQRLREEWPVILIVATIAGAAWMAAWNVQGFIATQIAASEARLTAQILETREQIAETREQIVEIRKYIVDHLGRSQWRGLTLDWQTRQASSCLNASASTPQISYGAE